MQTCGFRSGSNRAASLGAKDTACKFPPLRLNFPKGAAATTPFAGLDKIKLVTHCGRLGDTDAVFVNRVRLEYLLYRVFERISPTSLRVRAVDVTYADTDRGGKRSTHPGFLIEPEAALAARLALRKVDVEAIGHDELEPDQASRVEMFEYLAGNTDFSMTLGPPHDKCCHNIVPLAASDGRVLPVPYDFDATGIVGAPYARPSDRLSIRSVRRRLWRGYCRDPQHLQTSARIFRDAQTDIYALFRQDARLDAQTIEKTTAYLDEFYAVLGDSAAFDRLITSRCLAP